MSVNSILKLARNCVNIGHYNKAISLYELFQKVNSDISDVIAVNKAIIKNKRQYQYSNTSDEYCHVVFLCTCDVVQKMAMVCGEIPVDIEFSCMEIDVERFYIKISYLMEYDGIVLSRIGNCGLCSQMWYAFEHKNIELHENEIRIEHYSLMSKEYITTDKNIVFICDKNFIMPTIVAVNSCIANSMCLLNIYIIAVDCKEELITQIKICPNHNVNINIIAVKNIFSDVKAYKGLVTSAAMYKFFIPKILYKCNRALYLDSDTIIMNGLSYIFDIDLNESYAAVVEDIVGTTEHKEHHRINSDNYFNSGMMFLNLKKMREENLPSKMLEMKLTNNSIKYMDQDIFNKCFAGKVQYIDCYYNYMTTNTRLAHSIHSQYFQDFNPSNIRILHYSYLKPWNDSNVYLSNFWHDEYRRVWGYCHQNSNYTTRLGSTDRLSEYYKKSNIRKKSVLIIEAADCHGEVIPGFVTYFKSIGFNIDVIMTNNNFELNPLSRISDHSVRIYHNDKYSLFKLIDIDILSKYFLIIFTSRSLYYHIDNILHPTIYQYFKNLRQLKNKIISVEHHLEYIDQGADDNFVVLANPAEVENLKNLTVNFPCYGNFKMQTKKNDITKFVVVGNIENKRKNFDLLINTFSRIPHLNYSVEIIARRGDIELPDIIKGRFNISINAPYEKLYQVVEDSDFILPLLDPTIEDHMRYLSHGTSGTFQLVYGFHKPCILHQAFAKQYFLSNKNSILYNSNEEFYHQVLSAIEMDNNKYENMVHSLKLLCEQLHEKSEKNLLNIFKKMNITDYIKQYELI